MIAKTRRWIDGLVELLVLRLVAWFYLVVTTYPGVLQNPHKLANWFDDHTLYAFDEADRITLLKYGQLPAWNPYWCGGCTGIAEPEDSFYSPDFLLRLIFGSEHGRRLAIILFMVAGFEGMYRLCRRFDSTPIASALGAVAFMTCDRFVSFIHDGWVHFMSFGLASWVLLALLNGVTSVGWRLWGGFFLAWLVLAPGTYPAPYTAVAFGYLFVCLCAHRFFTGAPAPFKGPLLSALTIGGVAFLLAACKLIPTTLYMRQFPRVFTPTETHTIVEMITPFLIRYGMLFFLGIVAVVAADLGGGIALGGALLFLLLSLGNTGPWAPFNLMKKLPMLSALRYPDRFHVMVLFFISLGASRGLSTLEDAFARAIAAGHRWLRRLPLRALVARVTKRDIEKLDTWIPPKVPVEMLWAAVLVGAIFSWRITSPLIEELAAPQRAPSMQLYVEEAPRNFEQEFKQSRGNRRDSHIFPHVNMGSINCVAGIPVPESTRLRGDLPQEEYPADPNVATVKRISWSPNAIVLDVDAKAATTILVNQNWAPEWRSNVGTVRSEELLLAVDVPAGKHTLRLNYTSWVVYLSALLSLVTLLALLWYGGRHVVRAAKRERVRFETLPLWPVERDEEGPPEEPPPDMSPTTKKAVGWLALLDFRRLPSTKAGWVIRGLVTVLVVLFLWRRVVREVKPMVSARPPTPIPSEEVDDYRFRMPERTRREIFTELATAEIAERQRAIAANTWNGHQWSREDDRGHYERVAVRAAAAKHKVSITQVYLVLDEGIRNHWPAPDGKPLPATSPPLDLRKNSW
ncbi:MAG: hypothetical protein KIT84_37190 [Labilithrix sp.]|nr:hypothetical protein [Labilithrix sp.]MCW5816694.1 hypothetical protein [Labilithrix sp.]